MNVLMRTTLLIFLSGKDGAEHQMNLHELKQLKYIINQTFLGLLVPRMNVEHNGMF